MSTENPVIRNFKGLEAFESLLDRSRIHVTDSSRMPQTVEPGGLLRYSSIEIGSLGLRLTTDWTNDEIQHAVAESKLDQADVQVWVIAEDGFLKERSVLASFAISEVPPMITIAPRSAARVAALANPLSGFEISVAIILSRELNEHLPFKPHRKGTILASTAFTVRGTQDAGGLDPEPLTDEVRTDAKLPKSTILFVECDGALLNEENLGSVLHVYVHQELLRTLGRSRGPEALAILQQLAIEAFGQIVHVLHEEINDETEFTWDGQSGVAMRLLWRLAKTQEKSMSADRFVTLVRDSPRTLSAILSGIERQQRVLMNLLDDEDDEIEEES